MTPPTTKRPSGRGVHAQLERTLRDLITGSGLQSGEVTCTIRRGRTAFSTVAVYRPGLLPDVHTGRSPAEGELLDEEAAARYVVGRIERRTRYHPRSAQPYQMIAMDAPNTAWTLSLFNLQHDRTRLALVQFSLDTLRTWQNTPGQEHWTLCVTLTTPPAQPDVPTHVRTVLTGRAGHLDFLSFRRQPNGRHWTQSTQMTLPLPLAEPLRLTLAEPDPVRATGAHEAWHRTMHDVGKEVMTRMNDRKMSFSVQQAVTATQGSLLTFHAPEIRHDPLSLASLTALTGDWDAPTDVTGQLSVREGRPVLDAGESSEPLSPECGVLLFHVLQRCQTHPHVMLTWNDHLAGEQLHFLRVAEDRIAVRRTSKGGTTTTLAVLALGETLRALQISTRIHLQQTLPRPETP